MEQNIVGMREKRFILQTRRNARDRIILDDIVKQMRMTQRIAAVMAQPVIHTIAEPRAIVNHIQRALPEIQPPHRSAYATGIHMAFKQEVYDARMKGQYGETRDDDK